MTIKLKKLRGAKASARTRKKNGTSTPPGWSGQFREIDRRETSYVRIDPKTGARMFVPALPIK